jgi:NAD(P)-dependent dehydrogenase (short-subunit alcohol dehydrogenase family)
MTTIPVVFITGAAQGIGRAMTQLFLARGYRVAMADFDRAALKEAATRERRGDLDTLSDEVLPLMLDVSQEGQVRGAIQQIVRRFGRIDVLINNAGLVIDPTPGFPVNLWHKIIATNLTGAFFCAKYALPHLKKTHGSIINIASTRALMSEPNTEAYSASKGGLVALTHSLAISLGPDVRVNCISPGWIATENWKKSSRRKDPKLRPIDHKQHPVGRVGKPEDIATLAYFLASPDAGFITGQNFVADGGMVRKMVYEE